MNSPFTRVLGIALLVVTLSLASRTALASPASLTEDEYWGLVRESRAIVAGLKDKTAEEVSSQLETLAAQWDDIVEVSVDGQKIPVDHRYLTAMMRADEPDLVLLEETFASFLDARLGAPSGRFTPADLLPLTEILARPEYQWLEAAPNPAAAWIQNILDQLNRLLNELLGVTFDIASSDAVGVLMALILVVVLVFVFRALFTDMLKEEQLAGNEEDVPLTSEAALAKARQLSRGGDYRSAVRYLYLSTLLILDERGVVRYDRSKTNREYLRSVADAPELSHPLGEVIEVFDNVWYGYHALEEESFQHYSRRVEELKEKRS